MSSSPQYLLHPLLSLALTTALGLSAFADDKVSPAGDAPSKTRQYVLPEKTDDGWAVGSIQDAGFDVPTMAGLLNRIADGTYPNIHSMLLVKDDKLVFEEYFPGKDSEGNQREFNRDTLHTMQSCSKSVNSLLIGIAIDRHLISGVDEKLSTFFPQFADIFAKDGKDKLLLKDCLSMTAGLAWVESGIPYTDPKNDAYGLNRSKEPVRYVLDRPFAQAPGKKWLYNSGISVTLGEVVHKATGQPVDEFAKGALFGPLGITNFFWGKLPSGEVHTGGGLWLRPRDMAKIGYLCLNGGCWQGKQIVSEDWVHASTNQQAAYKGYGYQWWLRTLRLHDRATEIFAAQGLGGQFIIVIPDLHMVAVFTCWNVNPMVEQPFEMLQQYVIPAVESAGNGVGARKL